jgi:hypothetical protein
MARLVYEVSFKGSASDMLAGAFQDCAVDSRRGVTLVRSPVADQSALKGLLDRIHGLGLELLEVHLVAEPADADAVWVEDSRAD